MAFEEKLGRLQPRQAFGKLIFWQSGYNAQQPLGDYNSDRRGRLQKLLLLSRQTIHTLFENGPHRAWYTNRIDSASQSKRSPVAEQDSGLGQGADDLFEKKRIS